MQDLVTGFVAEVPRLVGALVILVVGLIVAAVVARVVRAALRRTGVDRRLAGALGGGQVDAASVVGRAIYYPIVLFVLIAVLNALGLTAASVPLALPVGGILGFVPKLVSAAILVGLLDLLGHILLGLIVFAVALWLARRAAGAVRASGVPNAGRSPGWGKGRC